MCIAVTMLSLVGVVLSYTSDQMVYAVDVIKVYIQYAMVVFAAYSGNSAVEKWLVHRWGSGNTATPVEDDEAEQG